MLIDDFMPQYHFHETHSLQIKSSPQKVFEAIRTISPSQILLLQTLFAARVFFSKRRGKPFSDNKPIMEQALNGSFVLLGEEKDKELVLGSIGQFWKLKNGSFLRLQNAQDFIDFDKKDYAKAVMYFHIQEIGNGLVEVSTETRIFIAEPHSRNIFRLYWSFIILEVRSSGI